MRKVVYTFNVCKLDELTALNRRIALDSVGRQMSEAWNEHTSFELLQSINEATHHFGMNVANFSFGLFERGNYLQIDTEHFNEDEVLSLCEWLDANIQPGIEGSCPFTGTYHDCLFFEGIKKLGYEPGTLKRDIVRAIVYMLEKSIELAENEILNDESVIEYIEAHNLEFHEDGRIYHNNTEVI